MILANYHTHTNFCDGQEAPELYAEEACKQSLKTLGYSAHAPLPFPCKWTLPYENYQTYLETIQSLKEKYRNRLEILCGLEIDYIPNLWPKINMMLNPAQLDFFIGSIHFVDCFDDGTPWSVDGSYKEFYKGWTEIFKCDSHTLVRKYFEYTDKILPSVHIVCIFIAISGHAAKYIEQYDRIVDFDLRIRHHPTE